MLVGIRTYLKVAAELRIEPPRALKLGRSIKTYLSLRGIIDL